MKVNNDVVILGGGLAGLTAGIHLSKIGIQVTIIEKNNYPKHKVCGEYISNEVLPYLTWLEIDIKSLKPTNITQLQFSTSNKNINISLPLGGFGVSRYVLDEFLYQKAKANGCIIINDKVENVTFKNDEFTIRTSNESIIKSKIAIGAFGKRSNIDQKLHRNFIKIKSSWLAVKAHYSGNFPDDLVGLYNFKGGYCGVSKVENDKINICYLADYATFKRYKNTDDYQQNIVFKNKFLKKIFNNSELVFAKPLTISQISFDKKHAVENHILMIGDTAGLIHPLCGNGMAMAIHSAKIASELVNQFLKNQIKSRVKLENEYSKQWHYNFKNRLKMGRLLSSILRKPFLSNKLMWILVHFPSVLPLIIKKTHGKPIFVNQ